MNKGMYRLLLTTVMGSAIGHSYPAIADQRQARAEQGREIYKKECVKCHWYFNDSALYENPTAEKMLYQFRSNQYMASVNITRQEAKLIEEAFAFFRPDRDPAKIAATREREATQPLIDTRSDLEKQQDEEKGNY